MGVSDSTMEDHLSGWSQRPLPPPSFMCDGQAADMNQQPALASGLVRISVRFSNKLGPVFGKILASSSHPKYLACACQEPLLQIRSGCWAAPRLAAYYMQDGVLVVEEGCA